MQHKQYESLEIFKEAVENLIECIQKERGTVDLQPLFVQLTLDTTTAFLFGESVRSLVTPEATGESTFATAFNTAQRWVANRYRLLDFYWPVDGPEFRQACRVVHHFVDQIIDRCLLSAQGDNKGTGRHVFLDSIAKGTQDRAALRGQIINLLTAGRDTTACLLSWTLFVNALRDSSFMLTLLVFYLFTTRKSWRSCAQRLLPCASNMQSLAATVCKECRISRTCSKKVTNPTHSCYSSLLLI
jgi:cytochrome P450